MSLHAHSKAYLCIRLDLTMSPPRIVGAGVYSAPPWGLTTMGDEIYACVLESHGESYSDAERSLRATIDVPNSGLAWVKPLLGPATKPRVDDLEVLRPLVNERIRQEAAKTLRSSGKITAIKYLRAAASEDIGRAVGLKPAKHYIDELEAVMQLQDTTTIGHIVIPTVFLAQARERLAKDPEQAVRYLGTVTGLPHGNIVTILTYLRSTP